MKIGIFDSGVGGLIVARAIRQKMPEYDYVYLGDTKRVPYGNRSHETVYQFTKEAVEYLFNKENCALVILACNTASARALRRLQKENGERRKILGVLIPTAEEAGKYSSVGILATSGTVASNSFPREIYKSRRLKGSGPRPNASGKIQVFQNPAPILVPLIEEGEYKLAEEFIKKYLNAFRGKKLDALVLGCTHYPILKNQIKKMVPKNVKVISQDEIIPRKLREYLKNHEEIEKKLSHKGTAKILVTDITQNVQKLTIKWFAVPAGRQGSKIKPKLVKI